MTTTTKAFTYENRNSPVKFSTIEMTAPLGPSEILVDTKYVGLNPVDIKLKHFAFWNSTWILGHDFSGVVTQVGEKASARFAPGDKVCGFKKIAYGNTAVLGTSTRIDVNKNGVMKQPSNLNDVHAGCFTLVFATAWVMISESKIDQDSSVLVLGGATAAGSVLIQLLKRYHGVQRVVATCSPNSAQEVIGYGADEIIDYRASDYVTQLKAAGTKGKFLSVYDCVGGYTPISISSSLLLPACKGSTYVSINGDEEPHQSYSQLNIASQLTSGLRVTFRRMFGSLYNLRYRLPFASHEGGWPEIAPKIIEEHNIDLAVGQIFPAADIEDAIARLDKGARGKVVMKMS